MEAQDSPRGLRSGVGLTVGLLLLAGWAPVRAAEPAAPAHEQSAVAPLEEFPFDPIGLIVVPVTLNGKVYTFIVDTGATVTIYDTTLKSLLGSPSGTLPTFGAAGDKVLERFAPPDARLGRLSLKVDASADPTPMQSVLCFDMTMLRKVTGEPAFGIIGVDFIRRYIVQLDPDAGKIRFFPDTIKATEEWGRSSEVKWLPSPANLPIVAAEVGQTPAWFLIDTGGNSSGDLEQNLFDQLAAAGHLSTVAETPLETITGTSRIALGRVQRFSIGPDIQKSLIFGRGRMNLLGMDFLTRYRVTLDFPHNRLYLRPGKTVSRFEYPDMSGLHIIRDEGKTLVHSVDPGSPAHLAGIQTGDEIVQVNGKSAAEYKLDVIRRMFADKPGNRVEVRTRRDNREQTAELELSLFSAPGEKKP